LKYVLRDRPDRADRDAAGGEPRSGFTRLAEMRRTVDGDMGVLKLSRALVQTIEGDRIRTPNVGLPFDYPGDYFRNCLSWSEISSRLALICRRVARREASTRNTVEPAAKASTPIDIVMPTVIIRDMMWAFSSA
jgi:hypothetical protein